MYINIFDERKTQDSKRKIHEFSDKRRECILIVKRMEENKKKTEIYNVFFFYCFPKQIIHQIENIYETKTHEIEFIKNETQGKEKKLK